MGEEGKGVPVVLMHGIPTSARFGDTYMAHQADYLLAWMGSSGIGRPFWLTTTSAEAWPRSRRCESLGRAPGSS